MEEAYQYKLKLCFITVMSIIVISGIGGCKRTGSVNYEYTKLFPLANDGSYWKLHYFQPMSDQFGNSYYRIDSIFVSEETVDLKIVDTSGIIPDTSIKTYSIIKSRFIKRKMQDEEWIDYGIYNFGVVRVDNETKKVHSVRTTCNCFYGAGATYPSIFTFYESTVFDYNIKNGESMIVEHYYKNYEITATVTEFEFNKYNLKKQSFYIEGFYKTRTQFAGVLNTCPFAGEAIPYVNGPSGVFQKMTYYDSPDESLDLSPDFQFY